MYQDDEVHLMTLVFPRRSRILGLLLLTAILLLPSIIAHASPGPTALQAFEAIRVAEDSGADISNLVAQYNNLLQEGAQDSAYNTVKQLAGNAQTSAAANMSFDNSLTLVLVPLIALALTLASIELFELRKRLSKERLLDMEIKQA
jgi:hypothetical protein